MNVYISANDRENLKVLGLTEHTCEICGKKFECSGNYVYKYSSHKRRKTLYYCSWKCYRQKTTDTDLRKEAQNV